MRSGLRAARGGGAKCLNGSTIEATVRGQPDRLLKEAHCAASGRPEYTGHWNPETKSGKLRLNHSDHVRSGSTTGRRHCRLHERPQARPVAEPRGLSRGRSLPRRLTPKPGGRSGLDPTAGLRTSRGRGTTTELRASSGRWATLGRPASRGRGTTAELLRTRSGRRARRQRRAVSSESSVFKIELE